MAACLRHLLLAAALACGCGDARASDINAHADEIAALVAHDIKADGPGVAVLVSRDGLPMHVAGYGLADLEARKRITPDSLFDLASVSKQITAVAILTLVESGRLNVDDEVRKYLPDFAVPVKGRAVRVTDLIHHVSGLTDYCSDDWDDDDDAFAKLTLATHLQWLNATKPRRAPGLKYEYNNTGYALLALIVQRVSGQTFEEYLREHVFDPAGMHDTFVLDGSAPLPAKTVKGYTTDKSGTAERSSQPTIMVGDGNIYTSVRDLARWDAALRGHKIISAEWQSRAWRGGYLDNGKPITDEDGDGYGYGWVIEKPGALVSHSGSWDGTSAYILMDLRSGLTVAVLSNDETMESGELATRIAELFETD